MIDLAYDLELVLTFSYSSNPTTCDSGEGGY
jgi:hypothetical protein